MCCCGRPTVNGEPKAYSWDGKSFITRQVDPPDMAEGDVLLYDEPGRCGGVDSHSHHFRLVKVSGSLFLLVRHGGGQERLRLHLYSGAFDSLDSNGRYWIFCALHYANRDGEKAGRSEMAQEYRTAFIDGRLKKRRLPKQGAVKVWIEPQTTRATA